MHAGKIATWLGPVFVLIIVCAYVAPIFKVPGALINDDPYRYHDYLQQASYDRLFRQGILEHHQFPLRTYMLGGGYPLIANPQDTSFSPFVLTSLVFGEVLGIKINILFFFLIGAGGMMLLMRKGLGIPLAGAAFAACAYCLSAWWASRVEWGFYFKFYFHFFPLVFYLYLKAKTEFRFLIFTAMALVVVTSQLGLGLVVIFLYLGCYELVEYFAGIKNEKRPLFLKRLALLAIILFLLGAVRIIPMAKLVFENSRQVGPYSTYTDQDSYRPNFYKGFGHFAYALTHYDPTPNYPIHPGWGVLLLALIGGAAAFKKSWKFSALTIVFIIFAFGPYFPIDFWRLIYHLPMFNSMHQPYQLTNYFILFGIALLSGYAFTLVDKIPGKTLPVIFSLVPFIFLLQPWQDNGHIYHKTFTKEAPSFEKAESFYHVRGKNQNRGAPRALHAQQYFNLLRNVGTIDWDGDIIRDESAEGKYLVDNTDAIFENKNYKGEAYLEKGSGTAEIKMISPNKIVVKATNFTPDRLVINQNFDEAWHGPMGFEIENRGGLIAIKLENTADWEIELAYLPLTVIIGLLISIFSWVIAIYLTRKMA